MREIKKIIIHCAVSESGDVLLIDGWHKERGWDSIGYHFVILNGMRNRGEYKLEDDGLVEEGRPLDIIGAHVKRHNTGSIGICLIGDRLFSAKQLYEALPKLLAELLGKFDLTVDDVYGHYEYDDKGKTCPNIDMDLLRASVKRLMWPGSMEYDG